MTTPGPTAPGEQPGAAEAGEPVRAHWLTQRFDDASVEDEFRRDYAERTLWQARVALAFGIVVYVVFGLLDRVLVPEVAHQAWAIRYALVVPAGLALLAWSFSRAYLRWSQLAGAAIGALAGGGIVAMVALASGTGRDLYYAGLLQAMAFTYTFLRLRFVPATMASWLFSAAYLAVLASDARPDRAVAISNAVVVISFNAIGMAACYVLEQAMRRDFLQRRVIARQAAGLARSLAEVKVLTGLLPICAWCHDVHAEDGSWQRIEAYLADRSDASFTHGICPKCMARVSQEMD